MSPFILQLLILGSIVYMARLTIPWKIWSTHLAELFHMTICNYENGDMSFNFSICNISGCIYSIYEPTTQSLESRAGYGKGRFIHCSLKWTSFQISTAGKISSNYERSILVLLNFTSPQCTRYHFTRRGFTKFVWFIEQIPTSLTPQHQTWFHFSHIGFVSAQGPNWLLDLLTIVTQARKNKPTRKM